MEKRPIFQKVYQRLSEPRRFIQVLLGPRQVGKTTLALQIAESLKLPFHYITADIATIQNASWIEQEWEVARLKVREGGKALLIIDEVQKIPHWADIIKALWDADTRHKRNLAVVILGSSPWLVQKGLIESLAGRFEIIPMTHWSFGEMSRIFGWSLEQFLYFGGYPGAAPLVDEADVSRWMNYINDSLIETTVSRDILLMTQINKPALLRRLFQLSCSYSAQILSYTKMLGELQEAGNTTTLTHYSDLLAGVGLIGNIQKFASQKVRQKGSSPKFCVYNTALMTAQSGKTYVQARQDPSFWGRIAESAVGAHLLNSIRGTTAELFYWREGDKEVDFVLRQAERLTAIEVKSGITPTSRSGMDTFSRHFPVTRKLLVGAQGVPLADFLGLTVSDLL